MGFDQRSDRKEVATMFPAEFPFQVPSPAIWVEAARASQGSVADEAGRGTW